MHGVDDIEFKAKKSLITLRIVYELRILVDYIIIENKKMKIRIECMRSHTKTGRFNELFT